VDTGQVHGWSDRYQEADVVDLPAPGKKYLIYMVSDVGPNVEQRKPDRLRWSDDPAMLEAGFPGNSDPHIRRFHGWRGTTDDRHIEALGVRRCLNVRRKEFARSVRYHLRFGADLRRDEP
jgi:hypothetical protein